MQKNRLFISIECILYICFMTLDLVGYSDQRVIRLLKYSSIVLCFFYVLLLKESQYNKKDLYLVRKAFLFTVMADTCLVLYDKEIPGILFFILVQCVYAVRLKQKMQQMFIMEIAGLGLLVGIFYMEKISIDIVLVISMIYGLLFLQNVIKVIRNKENGKFVAGLVLYFLCDINVAVFNASSYLSGTTPVLDVIYQISMYAIWFYYLPGQVLLAMSVKRRKNTDR